MISPVVQCLLPLLLVAGVVHPYYIEKQIQEHAPAESTHGPIQEHAPAESTHGPVEVEHKPIENKVIIDPVEDHINEPNDHVVMVGPNFNLGEHLSAYQMN